MQWILWFGQIVAFLIGVISLLWMIGSVLLAVLGAFAEREEYRQENERSVPPMAA